MAEELKDGRTATGDRPSGLSPEDKSNLKKAGWFVLLTIGVILGLKLLLGY